LRKKFPQNFQGMFPELGDVESPLMGLNNYTPSEGQSRPPLKKSNFLKIALIDICGNYERISYLF